MLKWLKLSFENEAIKGVTEPISITHYKENEKHQMQHIVSRPDNDNLLTYTKHSYVSI